MMDNPLVYNTIIGRPTLNRFKSNGVDIPYGDKVPYENRYRRVKKQPKGVASVLHDDDFPTKKARST